MTETLTGNRTIVYDVPCGTDTIYWSGPVDVAGYATLRSLIAAYEPGEGRHYFDPATLRWFGSRNTHVYGRGGCCTVECQTKAPAGVDRYKVTVWLMRDGRPQPAGGCRHDTLAHARACADRYFDWLSDPAAHIVEG